MTFSSLVFLFRFLPFFLLLYFLVPKRMRNLILFLGSLIFYGWGEPLFLIVMLFSACSDYIHGILIDKYAGEENGKRAKMLLISSIVINLVLLGVFKYTGLLPLPIGISFYTFQTMSYTIDVYKKEVKVQKNFLDFSVFVTMFPQLIAGPIVKYKTVEADLKMRNTSADQIAYGIKRLIIGLGKKVLLANNVGMLWEYAYSLNSSERTVLLVWIGAMAYALQIYFDFSGYSDMAIGLGAMLGFHFPENFHYPYIAQSITDFWRRWHISLSSWFKEYVYIPLGGNQKGVKRQLINILIVWTLTGIWHGAGFHFLVWGLWFAVFLMIEKIGFLSILKKVPAIFRFLYTLIIILISWVFFASESLTESIIYIQNMFGMGNTALSNKDTLYQLNNYYVLLIIGMILSTPIVKIVGNYLEKKQQIIYIGLESVGLVCIFFLSVAYIVDASYNPFLYFRF